MMLGISRAMVVLLAASCGTATGCSRAPGAEAVVPMETSGAAHEGGVAVVELFTSEGCSSCPRADALLGKLVAETRAQKRNVLLLSFHVDYWDGLGFPDPWANGAHSARQRSYARQFGLSGVYTPQAVISGTGSDEAGLRARIEKALSRVAPVRVEITLSEATASPIDVAYSLVGPVEGSVVHAALVERDLVDTPTAGENEGTTIHHQDVVRAFETVRAETKGTIALGVPTSVRRDHASVIVYVQRTSDLAIVGGAMRDVAP